MRIFSPASSVQSINCCNFSLPSPSFSFQEGFHHFPVLVCPGHWRVFGVQLRRRATIKSTVRYHGSISVQCSISKRGTRNSFSSIRPARLLGNKWLWDLKMKPLNGCNEHGKKGTSTGTGVGGGGVRSVVGKGVATRDARRGSSRSSTSEPEVRARNGASSIGRWSENLTPAGKKTVLGLPKATAWNVKSMMPWDRRGRLKETTIGQRWSKIDHHMGQMGRLPGTWSGPEHRIHDPPMTHVFCSWSCRCRCSAHPHFFWTVFSRHMMPIGSRVSEKFSLAHATQATTYGLPSPPIIFTGRGRRAVELES